MVVFNHIQILVVDDEESIRRLTEKELANSRRTVRTAATAREAFDLIRRQQFDVVVLDIRLPDGDGLDLLEKFREAIPDVEVILITGHGNIDSAVEAMKIGAYDYITKPFTLDRLELVIEKAYQRVCLQRENRLLRHTQSTPTSFPRIVGHSHMVQHVLYLVAKVAPTNVPVLITGESGVGKDVVANAIHGHSRRVEQPLIIKNCATLQKELILSELFGYCKGAFTGATESREGLMALAHQGTLFLDEIGELPLEVQASLLRVLENQTYRRVGDKQERHVDVRFIFATNRNLEDEVKAGRFQEALYHRLNVFQIDILPLRQRKEDIPFLIEHFLVLLSGDQPPCRISKDAMQALLSYNWPGNIRELRNVIERGIILSENDMITPNALPKSLIEQTGNDGSGGPDHVFLTLDEIEKRHILRALEHAHGNRSQAADLLGIGRKTLYRKLKEYCLA
jgi:two-component system, NtrC family, response regulator